MVLGLHSPLLSYYHLMLHAYFKAMLFICAGCTIHLIKDYQDIRTMGLGYSNMPYIYRIIMVCNLRLCGLPFLRGFYSKDAILEYSLIGRNSRLVVFLVLFATMLTLSYSLRIILILGAGRPKSERIFTQGHIDFFIFLRIIMLYPFSIFGGCVIGWYVHLSPVIVFLPYWAKLIVPSFLITGGALRWLSYLSVNAINLKSMTNFCKNIFFLPHTLRYFSSDKSLRFGKIIFFKSESQWIEHVLFKKSFYFIKSLLGFVNNITMGYYISRIFILLLVLLFFM